MSEIKNKITESGLISLDLAAYKPTQTILGIENDWTFYSGKAVYIHCSADAIIPTWAYMLIASKLVTNAVIFLVGSKEDIQKQLIKQNIKNEILAPFIDARVIIKGCSDIPCADFAMVELVKHLQPVLKSLMFGEPCSTVPIYKKV